MTSNERWTALAHLVIGVAVQMIVAGLFWLATGSWAVDCWVAAMRGNQDKAALREWAEGVR